ncbi:uncharacterized protein LOC100903865 [Galendromus occidentalis]|uniref:Uncharacterized protein LOC100903865 n=1 Tax=Galendromus occidentalis TaxID=34638 RepID=A0AAJ6QMJ5_9ACAR|nr:uncharacterized protein LOC100903865 [Galendromus occidentalis]
MEVGIRMGGQYAAFWVVDRICKYFVDRDYDKRYQIWRSEFEILMLIIFLWSAWFRTVPWVFLALTLLTWLASVPNEGHQILFRGRVQLIIPLVTKAFKNTLRHYRNLRDGAPGASESASLIERIVFSVFLLFAAIREKTNVRGHVVSFVASMRSFWRDTIENYRNMEPETPHQSFVSTQKSVSFEASPTVYTFSPPQMSSTPNNNFPAPSNGSTPQATSVGRRVSLRRQAKTNHTAVKTT